MPRPSGIWFRKRDGFYYTTYKGEQLKLSQDKDEAQRALHSLLAKEPEPEEAHSFRPSFRKLADLYLAHAGEAKAEKTFQLQRFFLQSFCDYVRKKKAMDVKVADVTAWLLRHKGWGHNSQVTARAIVRSCFNWAVDQGHLTHSPIGRLKAGGYHRKDRVLSVEEKRRIYATVRDQVFKDFLFFLEQTGARPFSEAALVTSELIDFEAGTITFVRHKNARKGKTRIIYMTDELAAMLRRRLTDGYLFTTCNGFPFTAHNTIQRLRRIEARLKIKRFTLNAYRHAWITEALEKGLSSDIVGELVGNTAKTIAKFYSHLSERKTTLREAMNRAVS